jgi:hypothetical protein
MPRLTPSCRDHAGQDCGVERRPGSSIPAARPVHERRRPPSIVQETRYRHAGAAGPVTHKGTTPAAAAHAAEQALADPDPAVREQAVLEAAEIVEGPSAGGRSAHPRIRHKAGLWTSLRSGLDIWHQATLSAVTFCSWHPVTATVRRGPVRGPSHPCKRCNQGHRCHGSVVSVQPGRTVHWAGLLIIRRS